MVLVSTQLVKAPVPSPPLAYARSFSNSSGHFLSFSPLLKEKRERKRTTSNSLSLSPPSPTTTSCREAKARKDETDIVRAVKRKQERQKKSIDNNWNQVLVGIRTFVEFQDMHTLPLSPLLFILRKTPFSAPSLAQKTCKGKRRESRNNPSI